jgi:pimeloyl-ACP methyl ester carboxylesterase
MRRRSAVPAGSIGRTLYNEAKNEIARVRMPAAASLGLGRQRGTMASADHSGIFVTAQDGLRLHARTHGRRSAPGLPVICLPGLARTGADFEALAAELAQDTERPRWVVALDYRGRGRSDHDRNPANYNFATELGDVIAVLDALDVGSGVFIGTSRGGLLTMLLASSRPGAIAGAVLNDIGPVIEPKGLMRIKSYVGKLPQPKSHEEGAEILRRLFGGQFPKLAANEWLGFARRTWEERDGRLIPTYDVRLSKTLDGVELERPLPPLWQAFDALARVPLMVIRGANSDILSTETVAGMTSRRRDTEVVEIADQGHAPLLTGLDIIRRIAAFVGRCDESRRH